MVLIMPRPFKHPRTGVYWLRRRVPADLAELVGKREELLSLKTKDADEAKQRFLRALADLEVRWDNLRKGPQELTEREAHRLAARIHDNWLLMHADNPSDQFHWQPDYFDRLWTESDPLLDEERSRDTPICIDALIIRGMRRFCLQQTDHCARELGLRHDSLERFRLAKAVSAAFQRASRTLQAVASGRTDPAIFAEQLTTTRPRADEASRPSAAAVAQTQSNAIAVTALLERWWREAAAAGRKPSTHESYRNTIKAFTKFLGHDDAGRVTTRDVIAFKDHRLLTPSTKTGRVPSAKTVKDSDLSALKTIFGWALGNQLVLLNPAAGVTIKLGKNVKVRSKGFTDPEAQALLTAALQYTPGNDSAPTAAAKRWVPWLCAFTGARVGEIAQLRKQDLTQQGDLWIIRITPEAGTVKNNEAREVVLHPQLVELGFPAFVRDCAEGHLFLKVSGAGDVLGPLRGLKNRLAEFGRLIVADPAVAPNRGWRHRFKTIGMEVDIAPRILDAIQGQAARSVGDTYGDVTIKTIAAAILKIPRVSVARCQ